MTQANSRTADHPIDPIFLKRFSPRAFTGEAIPVPELMTLFEAARWAPSAYNSQPWRLFYARRDTAPWPLFLSLLNEHNQTWAKNAAAIVVVASKPTFTPPGGQEMTSKTQSYDSGAAWANLALQATMLNWIAHGIVGFDLARAAKELKLPEDWRVEAGIVIGRLGDKSILPEALAAREGPNGRRPLNETAFEGGWPG
ncbi:nitroreductase family protein [Ferrovibrio sp. MS7]|jgi:nitroreductase|uniref:nitroreductase family protein n=1 Tax=Ferrovibrio plantarum TaxID=3119164 RepID=UPI001B3DA49D|nr:nitroreductase family protein [Ferrovibrio sp.]